MMKRWFTQIEVLSLGTTLVMALCSSQDVQAQAAAVASPPASVAAEGAAAPKAAATPIAAPDAAKLAAAAAADSPAKAASAAISTPRSTAPLFKNDVYGVEVMGAHISGSGYVIDVRYRVLDAVKAQPMLDRKVRPVLINEANGERFYVPQPPIVGALRQTARNNNIVPGKIYFMLFANPDKRIHNGDKISLYVGDQKFGVLEIGK